MKTNLIGIAGKMQAGKDTLGKMIIYLVDSNVDKSHIKYSIDNNCLLEDIEEEPSCDNPWEIKKFAGKVKEIVSILTGIPLEDLEKQEVKDRVLGEEWLVWKEESTFDSEFKLLHLEEPLTFGNCKKVQYTVRQLLQEVGTDAMRNVIHPNVWVNALFADYIPVQYHDGGIFYNKKEYPNWIITDVRFPNEAEAIKSRGGVLIRVERNKDTGTHPSETALDDYKKWNYIVPNVGTPKDLLYQAEFIVDTLKLK